MTEALRRYAYYANRDEPGEVAGLPEIFEALDAMTPEDLRRLARLILYRAEGEGEILYLDGELLQA